MKITSGDICTEVSVGVNEIAFKVDEKDQGFILEILRSKIYKNAIGAICREVASNSRDANREMMKSHVPVRIAVHDELNFNGYSSMHISFSDDGPGISPDRMMKVFCHYGKSTKQDSNYQTGGYGLGAKTPFAYNDMFTIVTRCEGKTYTYSAYIDESRKGKIALLLTEDTPDACNGTTILVPIKPNDRRAFEQEVIYYTQYWDVQPELTNFKHFNYETDYISSEMTIAGIRTLFVTKLRSSSSHMMIIDGIPYPIEMNQIEALKGLNGYSYDSFNYMAFCVGTGEVNLGVNRESLQYTELTVTTISLLVEEYGKIMTKDVTEFIEGAESYFHASIRAKAITENNTSYLQDYVVLHGKQQATADYTRIKEGMSWLNHAYPDFMSYGKFRWRGRPLASEPKFKKLECQRVTISDSGKPSYGKPANVNLKTFCSEYPFFRMDTITKSVARSLAILMKYKVFYLITEEKMANSPSYYKSEEEYRRALNEHMQLVGSDIAWLLDLQPPMRSYAAFEIPKSIADRPKVERSKSREVSIGTFRPNCNALHRCYKQLTVTVADKMGVVQWNDTDKTLESVSHLYVAYQHTSLKSAPVNDQILRAILFCELNPEFRFVAYMDRNKKHFKDCLKIEDVQDELDAKILQALLDHRYLVEIKKQISENGLYKFKGELAGKVAGFRKIFAASEKKVEKYKGALTFLEDNNFGRVMNAMLLKPDAEYVELGKYFDTWMSKYPLLKYLGLKYSDRHLDKHANDYIVALEHYQNTVVNISINQIQI